MNDYVKNVETKNEIHTGGHTFDCDESFSYVWHCTCTVWEYMEKMCIEVIKTKTLESPHIRVFLAGL